MIVTAKKQIRQFKGVWIPAEIWLNSELSLQEKVFLVEIDSLSKTNRGCFASNKYFADFFGLSRQRCSQVVNRLVKLGWITAKENRKGKMVVERVLRVSRKLDTLSRIVDEPCQENEVNPVKESLKSITPNDRTTINNHNLKTLEKMLALDLRISEQCKFMMEQINKILKPLPRSARVLAQIAKFFVTSAQQDPAKIQYFKDAVEWARTAAAASVQNKIGLFVSKVKQETGWSASKLLLSK